MRIFLTGASRGIGRELVKLLIRDGHQVWGVARDVEKLRLLKDELQSDNFFYNQCDVSDFNQVSQVVQEMYGKHFIPEIVVLDAAIYKKDLESDVFNFSDMQEALAVNFSGALIWIEKFLPEMLKRNTGKFVAVSSTSAYRPDMRSVSLPASKAALSMAFRSLRLKYKQRGIKFATVHFGPVATDAISDFTDNRGRKKYFFILDSKVAAKKLLDAIMDKKNVYYFPFFVTLLFRLFAVFPDTWFARVSRFIKK